MTLAPEPWVWLARIRRPQGRKGEVFADLLTDFPEKFAERRRLWLLPHELVGRADPVHLGTRETKSADPQAQPIELTDHWLHKGGIVLHFAGVDSISAAEVLGGLIVAIPGAERATLTADEAYIGDLIGCALVDVAGAEPVPVGEIADVDRTAGPVPLLIVRGPAGEILIPFAKSYLRRIDAGAKRVEMSLPEGLIDLNASEEC